MAVEPAGADSTDACCAEAATVRQLAINAAAAQPRAPHADRPMPLLDASSGQADGGILGPDPCLSPLVESTSACPSLDFGGTNIEDFGCLLEGQPMIPRGVLFVGDKGAIGAGWRAAAGQNLLEYWS